MSLNDTVGVATMVLAIPGTIVAILDALGRRRRLQGVHHPVASRQTIGAQSGGWDPPIAPPPPRVHRAGEPFAGNRGRAVSFPRRVLSTFVDFYAIGIVGVLIAALFTGGENLDVDTHPADNVGLIVASLLLIWIQASTGRSPGKLLVGARLVPAGTGTVGVSFGRVLLRGIVASITSIFLISQLWSLTNPERRTLHDRLTSTRVIRTR